LRKILIVILLLLGFVISAQTGGRMRERKNQKRLLHRIVHQSGGGWKYRKTPHGKGTLNTRFLFKRSKPAVHYERDKFQFGINRERNLRRIHGNNVFYRRKYKRV
jgi:hypothetical protein